MTGSGAREPRARSVGARRVRRSSTPAPYPRRSAVRSSAPTAASAQLLGPTEGTVFGGAREPSSDLSLVGPSGELLDKKATD